MSFLKEKRGFMHRAEFAGEVHTHGTGRTYTRTRTRPETITPAAGIPARRRRHDIHHTAADTGSIFRPPARRIAYAGLANAAAASQINPDILRQALSLPAPQSSSALTGTSTGTTAGANNIGEALKLILALLTNSTNTSSSNTNTLALAQALQQGLNTQA